jgi:GAF domain-containing protein
VNEADQSRERQALDSRGGRLTAGVARDLSELARTMDAQPSTDELMDHIVAAAAVEIDGAAGAVITLLERGHVHSPAHSDDRARRIGLAQQQTGQGPCVDTSREHVTLRSDDLQAETRWPKWTAAAMAEGVRSVLSFQLFAAHDAMGALEVYADEPNAFDDDAENIGLLLASHAAIAMAASRKIANLHLALAHRDVIGQAKGILMERYKVDAISAFDLLIRASQMTHQKLSTIAEELATTGALPGAATQT